MSESEPPATRVVYSAKLSHDYDRRYVVVDATSGVVLDDAQGYGYKSVDNALRGFRYKAAPPATKARREAAKKAVKRWCSQHRAFVALAEQGMLYALKDGESYTRKDLELLLASEGLELPFPVSDLLKHWSS